MASVVSSYGHRVCIGLNIIWYKRSMFAFLKQIAAEKEKESVSRARSMSSQMPTPSVSWCSSRTPTQGLKCLPANGQNAGKFLLMAFWNVSLSFLNIYQYFLIFLIVNEIKVTVSEREKDK